MNSNSPATTKRDTGCLQNRELLACRGKNRWTLERFLIKYEVSYKNVWVVGNAKHDNSETVRYISITFQDTLTDLK